MVDVPIIKNKIIEVLKIRGPSLPVQIAGEIKQNSIFTSAFLSELVDEKKVKTSTLMVGGSHLYLLDGQENQLEKFTKYLHPKEAEALLLLKDKKVLKESEQEPAIRVALKEIKDFAESFKSDNEIYWKLILTPNSEIESLFQQIKPETKEEIKEKPKPEAIVQSSDLEKSELTIQEPRQSSFLQKNEPSASSFLQKNEPSASSFLQKNELTTQTKKLKKSAPSDLKKSEFTIIQETPFENPLVPKKEKPKKETPKSEFVLNVINFLKELNFRIIEEKEHKLKEYLALVEVDTPLGPITFLTQAKDKQTINDSDLQKLLSDAQSIPLPALMIYTGNLTKKSMEYAEKYTAILKLKKIE